MVLEITTVYQSDGRVRVRKRNVEGNSGILILWYCVVIMLYW